MLLLLDKRQTDPRLLKPPSGSKSWSVRWNLLSAPLMGLSDTANVWPDCAVPSLFFFVWHYQSSSFSLFLRHLVYLPICGSVKKPWPLSLKIYGLQLTFSLYPASWSKWTDDIATSWKCCHKDSEEEVDWCQTVPQKSLRQLWEVRCLRYALTPQWWR